LNSVVFVARTRKPSIPKKKKKKKKIPPTRAVAFGESPKRKAKISGEAAERRKRRGIAGPNSLGGLTQKGEEDGLSLKILTEKQVYKNQREKKNRSGHAPSKAPSGKKKIPSPKKN